MYRSDRGTSDVDSIPLPLALATARKAPLVPRLLLAVVEYTATRIKGVSLRH